MKGVLNDIKEWFLETAKVFRREFGMVFRDAGVMLFFFALPLAYPIVYAAIYNPEVTREMPVAVVDNSRTAESREFVRHADATQAIKICGYASDLAQARRWWEEKKCFAVIEIPKDFSQKIGRGEQGVVQFYSDVSLLLRYRTFLESITELQMATDTQLRERALNTLGVSQAGEGSGIQTEAYFLGDPQQGFASFILPGIVVLILQQSLILGVTMLGGTSNDRRRRNDSLPVGHHNRENTLLCDTLSATDHLYTALHPADIRVSPYRGNTGLFPVHAPYAHIIGTAGADIAVHGVGTRKRVYRGGVHLGGIPVPVGTDMAALCHAATMENAGRHNTRDMGYRRVYPHQQQRRPIGVGIHPLPMVVVAVGGIFHHRLSRHTV